MKLDILVLFFNLYTQSPEKNTPKRPTDYRAVIAFAFLDKKETVDMYLEIAYNTTNHKGKDPFI